MRVRLVRSISKPLVNVLVTMGHFRQLPEQKILANMNQV